MLSYVYHFVISLLSPMLSFVSHIVVCLPCYYFLTLSSVLGVVVRELTGDIQMTKKEIMETQMIVTTPEKWDVVTRKATGDVALAQIVRLLIIDEVCEFLKWVVICIWEVGLKCVLHMRLGEVFLYLRSSTTLFDLELPWC